MSDTAEIVSQNCLVFGYDGVIITSIVVIIGWTVNNYYAKKRQVRTELLAKKEALYREIEKLLASAREYYAGEIEKRKITKLEIVDQAGNIDRIIELIEPTNGALYNKYTVLYEAITDGPFGTESNIDTGTADEKFKRILLAKNNLCTEIESKFDLLINE